MISRGAKGARPRAMPHCSDPFRKGPPISQSRLRSEHGMLQHPRLPFDNSKAMECALIIARRGSSRLLRKEAHLLSSRASNIALTPSSAAHRSQATIA